MTTVFFVVAIVLVIVLSFIITAAIDSWFHGDGL